MSGVGGMQKVKEESVRVKEKTALLTLSSLSLFRHRHKSLDPLPLQLRCRFHRVRLHGPRRLIVDDHALASVRVAEPALDRRIESGDGGREGKLDQSLLAPLRARQAFEWESVRLAIGPGGETRTLRGRYVVGADGLRSVIGRRLGLVKTSRIWPRRIALVAHYRKVQGVTDMGEMHVDYDGYFGIVDVGDGKMNVAVVIPQSRAKRIGEDKTAFFEQWIASRPHLAERFVGAERITPVRATGPFATASRRAWAPGAALVGDAADFFDPFTGEGIYAALRGGELLAPHLLEALERPPADERRVLSGYDVARKREFGGKWKLGGDKALLFNLLVPMNNAGIRPTTVITAGIQMQL